MFSHPGTDAPSWFPFNLTSVVCFVLGAVIVALFANGKFAERTVWQDEQDDYIAQFLPRYLATREEYSRALIGYVLSMVSILGALSIIGPPLIDGFAPALGQFKSVAPLVLALLLVGLLPNVPWLQPVEWRVRRFWHARAYIPKAARATADTLRACGFDFSAYREQAVLRSADMQGVDETDFKAPRGSIEYGWARLSCLSHELQRRRDAGEIELLDGELLERYASDLDNIAAKRQAMAADVAQYRQQKASDPHHDNEPLRAAIGIALRRLYIVLGCAVRMRLSRSADVNAPFRSFGFDLRSQPAAPPNQDLIIVGIAVMTGSLLVLGFAAVASGALGERIGLWHPSANFPKTGVDPFIWAISAAIMHGAAIITSELTRARLMRRGRWFAIVGGERQAIVANYIRVAVACAAAGYIALYLLQLLRQLPTVDSALGTLPYALLPAATGAFYAFHLDNAELGRRPSRLFEIGAQTLVTALCGLFATAAWLKLGGDVEGNADFIIMVTVFSAVAGASLAWCLPIAAANRRADPEAVARSTRIASLTAAAIARLGGEEPAERWLTQPHPALGNLAPREAAANVEHYVTALGLLQGPVAVAV